MIKIAMRRGPSGEGSGGPEAPLHRKVIRPICRSEAERITMPASLAPSHEIAQRTGPAAWKAADLPTELLPHRI